MNTSIAAADALRELGFNQLEAEVYVFLLAAPPSTAYRVAQQLAKPAANVYKAIEVLARKGALLIEDGDNRLCRAVPVSQFLHRAERDFRTLLETANSALSEIRPVDLDDRVYRVESAAQVFQIATEMLTRARKIAVVDAFPAALARLEEPIRGAVAHGVRVFVEAYAPFAVEGVSVATAKYATASPALWRSEQLNLIVDGREHVVALLSADLAAVHQAIWSTSLYLSCIHHAGRLCEHTLIRMLDAVERGEKPEAVLDILHHHGFFRNDEVPGQHELLQRYVEPESPKLRSRRK